MARKYYQNQPYEEWKVNDEKIKVMVVQNTLNYWHTYPENTDYQAVYFEDTISANQSLGILELFVKTKKMLSQLQDSIGNPQLEFVTIDFDENQNIYTVQSNFADLNKKFSNNYSSFAPKPKGSFPYTSGYMPFTMTSVFNSQTSSANVEDVKWDLSIARDINGNVISTNQGKLDYNNSNYNVTNIFNDLFKRNARYHFDRVTTQNAAYYLYTTSNTQLFTENQVTYPILLPYYGSSYMYSSIPSNYVGIVEPFYFFFAGTGQYNVSVGGCQSADWAVDPDIDKKSWLDGPLLDMYLKNIFYAADKKIKNLTGSNLVGNPNYRYVMEISRFVSYEENIVCDPYNVFYKNYLGVRCHAISVKFKCRTSLPMPPNPVAPIGSTY